MSQFVTEQCHGFDVRLLAVHDHAQHSVRPGRAHPEQQARPDVMSTSTTRDMNDSVGGLDLCDEAAKCRRVIGRLSNEGGQSRVVGAHARVAGSSGLISGHRRLSIRADAARCDEEHDDHQPSPSKFPPRFHHGVSSSRTEAENVVET
jgi:hypothetical protein